MKKCWAVLLLVFLLAGCSGPKEYETMSDVWAEQTLPAAGELTMLLPSDAGVLTMEGDSGSIYLCDGYTVVVQTFSAGDLDATLRQVTGYSRDKLSLMERKEGDTKRYECVWACAGEGGDQVGRAVILDDGSYHYTVSLLADAATAGELTDAWQNILNSVSVNTAP